MKKSFVLTVCGALLLGAAANSIAAARDRALIVTSSNAAANQLLVYDTTGTLVQTLSTQGQGGVGNNAGGVTAQGRTVAVVNFGSQSVSLFDREGDVFEFRQLVPAVSAPVSVAFGVDHLYVLGTTSVESHRIDGGVVDTAPDGVVALLRADGSSAQVGVVGEQLVITEKSGVVEVVNLRGGAAVEPAISVEIPAGSDTPFGLVTRGSRGYVTIAHSDEISLIEQGRLVALAATGSGFPNGPGQQAPCWITIVGPYLFTSNSPSHSISRLLAAGRNLVLDEPVVATTLGAPIDIAAAGDHLAVLESDGNDASHVTQFHIDEAGNLVQTSSTLITAAANGVAIVTEP